MKYFKRANIYKASNVTFNPETLKAYSYDWWCFVKPINGKLVFNNYYYSNTTCRHQQKVRGLLYDLGIKIDLIVSTRSCLDNTNALSNAIDLLANENRELLKLINKPRTHKATNEKRRLQIEKNNAKIKEIRNLISISEVA